MWHVTRDMWHVTRLGGWTFSQNFSSLALTVCDLWYYEDLEEKDESLNDEAVYRTAPVTSGLLYIFRSIIKLHSPPSSCIPSQLQECAAPPTAGYQNLGRTASLLDLVPARGNLPPWSRPLSPFGTLGMSADRLPPPAPSLSPRPGSRWKVLDWWDEESPPSPPPPTPPPVAVTASFHPQVNRGVRGAI